MVMGGGGFQDSQPDTVTGQKISHWHPAEETQRHNKVLYYPLLHINRIL